jgi:hypothetical protein
MTANVSYDYAVFRDPLRFRIDVRPSGFANPRLTEINRPVQIEGQHYARPGNIGSNLETGVTSID